jgi:hypothetical protein
MIHQTSNEVQSSSLKLIYLAAFKFSSKPCTLFITWESPNFDNKSKRFFAPNTLVIVQEIYFWSVCHSKR